MHEKRRDFECEFCLKMFFDKCILIEHVRIFHEKRLLNCDFCSEQFRWTSDLRKHVRSVHSDCGGEEAAGPSAGDANQFGCEGCPEEFDSVDLLERHIQETHVVEGQLMF